jgi:hypothetical protein
VPRARLSTALELGIADPLQRARVQVDLAYVLGEIGRSPEAGAMFAAGLEAATNLGDRALAAQVLLQRTHTRLLRDPGLDATEAEAVAKAGMETFRELGDQRELAMLNAGSAWPSCTRDASRKSALMRPFPAEQF